MKNKGYFFNNSIYDSFNVSFYDSDKKIKIFYDYSNEERDSNKKFTLYNKDIPKEKFSQQLQKDCKECNFYSKFTYDHTIVFFNNKNKVKNIYWYNLFGLNQ